MSEEMNLENDLGLSYVPAQLEANFESVRDAIKADVAKYDVVVTQDTVTDAKKMRAELNARAKTINRKRIDTVKEVTASIRPFEEQMKELSGICTDGSELLDKQVKAFEQERKDEALRLLHEHRDGQWSEMGVRDDFRRCGVEHVATLSAVTSSGNLTKGARESVESEVAKDKSTQDMVDRRLANLETECYKSGLDTPVSAHAVSGVIESDEESYRAHLERLIGDEVRRQERAAAERERKADREAQQENKAAEKPEPKRQEPAPVQEQNNAPDGKQDWTCTVAMTVRTKGNVTAEQVADKLRNVMSERGFDAENIQYIQAVPHGS